jgi:DNA gyrase subunit B
LVSYASSIFPEKTMSEEAPENTSPKVEKEYTAADLRTLPALEAVRHRPGMYIGGTDGRALHQCVFEILDNSVDEFLSGYGTQIDVTVHIDGSISIKDNGRGIPVDIKKYCGLSMVEELLTVMFTGGWYRQDDKYSPYSCGIHGVGPTCVNALSEWFRVEVLRDGEIYAIAFERGYTTQKLKLIGELKDQKTTGTTITFKPDPLIFKETTEFKAERIRHRLHELAYTHAPLIFNFLDERVAGMKTEFIQHQPGEFPAFAWPAGKKPLWLIGGPMEIAFQDAGLRLKAVCQFAETNVYRTRVRGVRCYTNALPNKQGGSHLSGFLKGLAKALTDHAGAARIVLPGRGTISPRGAMRGLHAVIALSHPNPRYLSATKDCLYCPDADPFAAAGTARAMGILLHGNPEMARQILAHLTLPRQELRRRSGLGFRR